ncbi:hypothetical protein TgHK011_008959 [Trichoderma gracile]|nr:hypothetical protein TgHK011_008959 [Trichoderma gracile]
MPPDDIKSTSALLRAISNASAVRRKRSLSLSLPKEEDIISICCGAYRKKEDVFKAAQLRDMQENLEEEEEEAEIEAKAKIARDTILALWNANQTRIRSSLPRYNEGFPIRDRIRPPVLRPRRRQKPSGLGDCLQCLAKGLPCSMSVQTKGTGEAVLRGGCRRCVAEGERCIIEHEVVEDVHDGDDDDEKGVKKEKGGYGDGKEREEEESGLWDWWDGVPDREQDVDSAAEAIEMWERRRKGMTLELMGSCMLWVESRGFAPRGMMKMSD